MSSSVLLNLARKSIEEVLRAERLIDLDEYRKEFPILEEHIASFVTLYLDGEVLGYSGTLAPEKPLLEDIILNAKKAAFEQQNKAIKSSEYLSCQVEVTLLSPLEMIQFGSYEEMKTKITQNQDGVVINCDSDMRYFLPKEWNNYSTKDEFISALGIDSQKEDCDIYIFETQSAIDDPLLKDDDEILKYLEKN
jgi:AMMECR1 domain-containing protein